MGAAQGGNVYKGKKPELDEDELQMGQIFQTTRVVIWLIGNSDYSSVRKPGKKYKGDLTEEQKIKKEATYSQYKDIT